ncbi:hypothetical protein SmphiM6_29 [Sinorhizobium phage phiM6]|nr:hypothetical protein SmphiM6_29 [Sinorhizobium phage phiM6]
MIELIKHSSTSYSGILNSTTDRATSHLTKAHIALTFHPSFREGYYSVLVGRSTSDCVSSKVRITLIVAFILFDIPLEVLFRITKINILFVHSRGRHPIVFIGHLMISRPRDASNRITNILRSYSCNRRFNFLSYRSLISLIPRVKLLVFTFSGSNITFIPRVEFFHYFTSS